MATLFTRAYSRPSYIQPPSHPSDSYPFLTVAQSTISYSDSSTFSIPLSLKAVSSDPTAEKDQHDPH